MFINNFDPVAFTFLSLQIKWYSISYILGIVLGWTYCKKKLIEDKKILNLFDDLIVYIIFGIIIGGRLGYVLLYNLKYYLENVSEILMIWNGGMSFHGGILGIIFVTIIFSKKNNGNPLGYLDIISLVAPIGIFFGRISNFINSELYGTATNLPWAVKFIKIDDIYRHPSQLYEAIFEGLILFIILLYIFKKKIFIKPGIISAIFLILYSLFRFFAEFFRVPDIQIGYIIFNFSMGQVVSAIFFALGIYLFLKKNNAT